MHTYFSHLHGNEQVKTLLLKMVERDAVGNSLLFAGPEGVGKGLFAKAFAELLLTDGSESTRKKIQSETHPDLHIYRPEGKLGMHSIEAMRQLTQEIYLVPYEAKRKVFILYEADRMLSFSANSLLKTFEEPSLDSVIILLSAAPESLLPTIRSRFQTLYFKQVEPTHLVSFMCQHFQKTEAEAQTLAIAAEGSFATAARLCNLEDNSLQQKLMALLIQGKAPSYGKLLEEVRQLTEHLEKAKLQTEQELKAATNVDNLTAFQRESFEKEMEGYISVQTHRETHHLLKLIFFWYRDQDLLRVNGSPEFLFHRASLPELEQAIQQASPFSLDYVQKVIDEAKRALERSTSIGIVLENLFLKLNFY